MRLSAATVRRTFAMQTNLPPDEPPALTPGDWLRRGLVVALPVTSLVGAIAMLLEIRLLVGAFPVCGLLGLALAVAAAPLRHRIVTHFGQSAPLTASVCAAAIWAFNLPPRRAYVPINIAWCLYTTVLLALCWWPIRLVWSRPRVTPEPTPTPWRYSIRGLLLLTSFTVVVLTLGKLFGEPFLEGIVFGGVYSEFASSALVGFVLTGLAAAHGASHRRRGVGLLRRTPAPESGNSHDDPDSEKNAPETPPPDQPRG